jgi:hypothetical protein
MGYQTPVKRVSKFIAEGPFSLRWKDYEAARTRLYAEARAARAARLDGASVIARLRLIAEIQAEVRGKLDRMFPPGALYAVPGKGPRGRGTVPFVP